MVSRRLNTELIRSEKSRNTTFQIRKKGLKKKASEYATLCDVDTALLIFGPNKDEPVEIWPENVDDFHRIINKYRNQSKEEKEKNSLNLYGFLEERVKKMEDELDKLRQQNDELAYPTWDDRFNEFSEQQLRDMGFKIGTNIDHVEMKIELMKGNRTFLEEYSQPLPNKNPSSYMPGPASMLVPVPSMHQRSIEPQVPSMHQRSIELQEPLFCMEPLDRDFPMSHQSDPSANSIFDGSTGIGNYNPIMPMMNCMDWTDIGGFDGNHQYLPFYYDPNWMQEEMQLNDPGLSTVCLDPINMQVPVTYLSPTQGVSSFQMHF